MTQQGLISPLVLGELGISRNHNAEAPEFLRCRHPLLHSQPLCQSHALCKAAHAPCVGPMRPGCRCMRSHARALPRAQLASSLAAMLMQMSGARSSARMVLTASPSLPSPRAPHYALCWGQGLSSSLMQLQPGARCLNTCACNSSPRMSGAKAVNSPLCTWQVRTWGTCFPQGVAAAQVSAFVPCLTGLQSIESCCSALLELQCTDKYQMS